MNSGMGSHIGIDAEHAPATDQVNRDHWSAVDIVSALRVATLHLERNVSAINALNVFPVPDGDTGSNMLMTLHDALREVDHPDIAAAGNVGDVLQRICYGALMGARGNSGVILYQILAGFADGASGIDQLDASALAECFTRASNLAYQAVVDPVEGTILTVMRAAAEQARATAGEGGSIADLLEAAHAKADETLQRTPEMMEILQQAGVVDAGGQGLVVLLGGLHQFASGNAGETMSKEFLLPSSGIAASMSFLDQGEFTHNLEEFGYCMDFAVAGQTIEVESFRERMHALGTSVVVVGNQQTLKVHIHSENPGNILEAAMSFGELHHIRIENMAAQTRQLLAERAALSQPTLSALTRSPSTSTVAVVAVASGEGVRDVLIGMGASAVVPGGPTFNPSTEEILRTIEGLPQDQVIVLPNDSNVIPTARQVERLTSKRIMVVPSRSIPEGISALSVFNAEAAIDDAASEMTEALHLVKSLSLTRATRDAEINKVKVQQGQLIGMIDGELRVSGDDALQVVHDLLEIAGVDQADLVTLFVGEPAAAGLGEAVTAMIERDFGDLEVECAAGGQPHYDLIISLE